MLANGSRVPNVRLDGANEMMEGSKKLDELMLANGGVHAALEGACAPSRVPNITFTGCDGYATLR